MSLITGDVLRYICYAVALILLGEGIHLMISPKFWSADPFMVRVAAAVTIIIAIIIFAAARYLFK